jgi:transcriptional regulator with XRE-family HTH domain
MEEMKAATAYLWRLREKQKISRAKLANLVSTTENTIWRVETGQQEPGGRLLISLVTALQANWQDVVDLVDQKNATQEDGRARADLWLALRASRTPPDTQTTPLDQLTTIIGELRTELPAEAWNSASSGPLLDSIRWLIQGWRAQRKDSR